MGRRSSGQPSAFNYQLHPAPTDSPPSSFQLRYRERVSAPIEKLLIANRGEIAIRIARAAAELGIATVAVYSEDDARSLHVVRADEARALRERGAAAYLDAAQIIEVAREARCDAIHPGYGFLSESAGFARACADAAIRFVGPRAEILELFGDKARARAHAESLGVAVLAGTSRAATIEDVRAFRASLGDDAAIVIKAVAGGGGRGMRVVRAGEDLDEAYARCQSEARAAFGDPAVYVERVLPRARHIELQIVCDGSGAVTHLWERDCTLQRRHQKLIEIAPSPAISTEMRERIIAAAVKLAESVRYESLGTFEFLVDLDDAGESFYFIEANPRLQVEHTITEEITGIDLVQAQLQIAGGRSLAELGLRQSDLPEPRGYAIQLRINMETMDASGAPKPSGGTLAAFEVPSGPGIRVDAFGYAGYATSPAFDSLLAKLIVHSSSSDFGSVVARGSRALGEFRIGGVATNIPLLRAILRHADFAASRTDTRWIEEHIGELIDGAESDPAPPFFGSTSGVAASLAGVKVDPNDPLAVLHHGKSETDPAIASARVDEEFGDGVVAVRAPMQGTVIEIDVSGGETVRAGQRLLIMEAMKMEHVISAPSAGRIEGVLVSVGDAVFEGHPLVVLEPVDADIAEAGDRDEIDLEAIRADLAEVHERHAAGLDDSRAEAVARRRNTGQRTARENIEDLCDDGSFVEYGPLVIAAQRRRRSLEDLIANTPADGLVAGTGRVNGDLFDDARSRVIAMSYDYTVLAGTQGQQNHRKKDRMFELAEKWRLPIVFFTEGGGGRPGDTDGIGVAGLDCMAFHYFGRLSGLVPLVGVNSGRCFAGNAALLGCCDVVIATKNSNIGMGGPAMIEGGGLGVFRPEEVGPIGVQARNGVVDIAVEDEAEGVRAAKQYLSYFQGAVERWSCVDQRMLRALIPENRRRSYDIRWVISVLADEGSVLELRRGFGVGMVTALIRIEGRPLGLIANNPMHLGGAIDSDGADKAARFMQLCDAFDLPMLSLCDTPGIMVGPEVEKTALVRHASRMFVTGASISVPFFTIILRKGYGLGAQAMAGGSFKAPMFTVAWPTGEFGGMGLEGAVKLGYRNELAAIDDPEKRRALYEEMVERMYERGKAVNTGSHFEIDDVIDPMESRAWITSALRSAPAAAARVGKKRSMVDTW